MANAPRVEFRINLASNLVLTVNDGGGADACTVTAGTYYPSALLTAIAAALLAGVGAAFTVTGSFGSSGTGIITITKNAGTCTINFANNAEANLLGVATAITWANVAQTHTGTLGMQGVWIPKCSIDGTGLDLSTNGHYRSDLRQAKNHLGVLRSRSSQGYYSYRDIVFSHVERDRALDGANAAVISWTQAVREYQLGANTFFPVTGSTLVPVKIYADADTDTVLGSSDGIYQLRLNADLELPKPVEGSTTWWTVRIPEIVKS